MKILIADSDGVGGKIVMIMLKSYGACNQTTTIEETIAEFRRCLEEKQPYDVIFFAIGVQDATGESLVTTIRKIEEEAKNIPVKRVKCIMITTTMSINTGDSSNDYKSQWDGYLIKPISPEMLERELRRLGLGRSQLEIVNRRQLATLMIDVGDKKIVRELVLKFIAEFPGKLLAMKNKISTAEYEFIQRMAHELASLSGTYGFSQLSELLRNVEQGAAQKNAPIMVEGLVGATEQWQQIQGPLTNLLADWEVHDGK